MTPQQMMQMMQMQGWMQMQQQMGMAGTPAAGQPPAQQPAPAAPPFVVTSIVLVTSSKDGELVRADGQRTSVPIKIELNDAKEPTGTYSTAQSVREKAVSSFPDAGGDASWKLFIGELKDGQPSDVAFVAGDSDAAADSSWRELVSCKAICEQKPVIFVQPCLAGHEARDIDRKRAADMATITATQGEVAAAATVLSAARPAKQGRGQDSASARSGKAPKQLDEDGRVARLREVLQSHIKKRDSPEHMSAELGKSFWMLTDGTWTKPVFSADGKTMESAGFYRELKISDVDASFLTADGKLVKAIVNTDGSLRTKALQWACIHPACIRASNGKPWPTATVTLESESSSASSHHSAMTKAGGVCLRSFQASVKPHMKDAHGDAGSLAVKQSAPAALQQTARYFAIGSALLQQPATQQALQEAAAAQSEVEQPTTLTPADPPEPPPVALRYPFDAPADAKERDIAEIRLEDITTAKLADGSFVSWRVFDLLRRYELQCAINAGLSSEQVMVMPPYDYLQINRQIELFQKKNDVVIDLSKPTTFPVFQLLNSLQEQVGLTPSISSLIIEPKLAVWQPIFVADSPAPPPFGELQFVSIPIISSVHNSEFLWLPGFNIAFSFDSYPELHQLHVSQVLTFVQHVACSPIELVAVAVPHQPREGPQKNVCAFSATLFLQLALKLLKQHGPTPALVQALRELTVEESDYHKRRKQAAKDIRSLHNEYCRMKQAARMKEREAAKAAKAEGQPGTSTK